MVPFRVFAYEVIILAEHGELMREKRRVLRVTR